MFRQLNDAVRFWWTLRRKPLESFMEPVSLADGALLCRDGSLVSLVSLEGARSITGTAELGEFVELARRRLNGSFLDRGHGLHVVLERAPDAARMAIDAAAARQSRQTERLGLVLGDVISERAERLAGLLWGESCVLACWTRPDIVPAPQLRRERRELKKRLKAWLPGKREAQCPLDVADSLPPRHEAFVATVESLLRDAGLVAEPLGSHEAVRVMRLMLNGPDAAGPEWRPAGPGDEVWPRFTEPPELGSFPPPLAPQLLVREPHVEGGRLRIGGRLYGAVDMVLGPRVERPFSELMGRLAEAGLPFRFSMAVEGGGLAGSGPAIALAASSVLAVTSEDSRHVRDALAGLREIRGEEQAVVRLRVGLLTWVDAGDSPGALERRLGRVQQICEGWGECEFSPLVGDVLEAFAGTVPGFALGGTPEPALAPLSSVLGMLPLFRPASAVRPDRADYLFRSEDGKPLGYSLEESGDFGFDLVYGIPGRGKSVLLGSLSLAFCLQGGRRRLPLLAVVDIGPSSSGLISMIRDALPEGRRHEAGWFAPQMTKAHAINPCDTQLGCRYPLPPERAFLTNLLALVLTPVGTDGVPDGVAETISPMIDVIYRMREDGVPGAEPHRYTRGRDREVDEALARQAAHLPSAPLWWEVVDLLFDAGEIDAAARAQRYAAPTLLDCLHAVREPEVQDLVGRATYGAGGEPVTSAVIRILTALSGEWPLMFAPTAFDTGHVRVAAMDLAAVAPQGSPEADRQTAAMYMLARHVLTRHWWIGEETLAGVPERYRAWHGRRIREVRETPKRLVFDEYHRTASAPGVRAQVDRDVREARKQRVRLMLASQREGDFGDLAGLATGFWILGSGGSTEDEARHLAEMFALGDAAVEAIRFRLTGPSASGAPALHVAADAGGRLEQVLVNSVGPVELWALNTAPRDVAVRRRVQERLGAAAGRAALARMFPAGSARERIEAEFRALEGRGMGGSVEEAGVLDALAAEVVRLSAEGAAGARAAR